MIISKKEEQGYKEKRIKTMQVRNVDEIMSLNEKEDLFDKTQIEKTMTIEEDWKYQVNTDKNIELIIRNPSHIDDFIYKYTSVLRNEIEDQIKLRQKVNLMKNDFYLST